MSDMVCVKYNGISYCWNFETSQIEVFTKKEAVDVKDCPPGVVYNLLTLVSKKLLTKE
jgi:hypothetical protein